MSSRRLRASSSGHRRAGRSRSSLLRYSSASRSCSSWWGSKPKSRSMAYTNAAVAPLVLGHGPARDAGLEGGRAQDPVRVAHAEQALVVGQHEQELAHGLPDGVGKVLGRLEGPHRGVPVAHRLSSVVIGPARRRTRRACRSRPGASRDRRRAAQRERGLVAVHPARRRRAGRRPSRTTWPRRTSARRRPAPAPRSAPAPCPTCSNRSSRFWRANISYRLRRHPAIRFVRLMRPRSSDRHGHAGAVQRPAPRCVIRAAVQGGSHVSSTSTARDAGLLEAADRGRPTG